MNYFKKVLENRGKKIFDCPGCKKSLRIPIRFGKILRVTCPRCHVAFDISFKGGFKSPFSLLNKQNLLKMGKKRSSLILLFVLLIIFFCLSFLKNQKSTINEKDLLEKNQDSIFKEI